MSTNPEHARMQAFNSMTATEQRAAIQQLATDGHGVSTIAAATGFSVEMIRRILAAHAQHEVIECSKST